MRLRCSSCINTRKKYIFSVIKKQTRGLIVVLCCLKVIIILIAICCQYVAVFGDIHYFYQYSSYLPIFIIFTNMRLCCVRSLTEEENGNIVEHSGRVEVGMEHYLLVGLFVMQDSRNIMMGLRELKCK